MMKPRYLVLLVLVVLPGIATTGICVYYLFPEWAALDASYQRHERVAKSPTREIEDLAIAQAAENRHRINCFAEGVGALLGIAIMSIGIHGMCTIPKSETSKVK
ncbi:MAG: hypothetical protein KME17_22330 [Cyanosarcina radialis HA8281-LM2]|jgi:hypothetical protein|nr:hypothetical protein [Cyanosarcina radialis HA8281-LM2]